MRLPRHARGFGIDADGADAEDDVDAEPHGEEADHPSPPPPTRLAELLAVKRFVVSVEIDPPRSVRIERTIEAARLLQAAGVDAVNVSDSAMAKVRMGGFAVAFGIQHDLDLTRWAEMLVLHALSSPALAPLFVACKTATARMALRPFQVELSR